MIRQAAERLDDAGIPSPQTDAELLASHVWGISRAEVQTRALSDAAGMDPAEHSDRFWALIDARATRVPLQHLTGSAPFRWLEMRVGPGVFIPRPETETVVELVLTTLRRQGSAHPRVLDLGTGSGAIAASIAFEHPDAEVHAVEVSAEAAAWAELNFQRLPAGSGPVTLHHCDLRDFPQRWSTVSDRMDGHFDVVVSNPPYIPSHMVPVEPEVREHDPGIALYGGGPDGLEMPAAVIDVSEQLLSPGGWLILEHAEAQADAMEALCRADPMLEDVSTHQDLTGRPRATSATFRPSARGEPTRASERSA